MSLTSSQGVSDAELPRASPRLRAFLQAKQEAIAPHFCQESIAIVPPEPSDEFGRDVRHAELPVLLLTDRSVQSLLESHIRLPHPKGFVIWRQFY